MVNVIEGLALLALWVGSFALGNYFYRFVGWLAFVPTGFFSAILVLLMFYTASRTLGEILRKRKPRL